MTRHPIHLKRKEEEEEKKHEKTVHARIKIRPPQKKKKHQSVSHFEKYMYLLLFSLNYIVIPNPPSSVNPYF